MPAKIPRNRVRLGSLHPAIDWARKAAGEWDRQIGTFMMRKGVHPGYTGWDQLPPDQREYLERIWEEGHDNITAEKIERVLGKQ